MKQIYIFLFCLLGATVNAQSDITFSVDMSGYGGSFTTVYVSGSLNGWSGTDNPMTDMGGGIWQVTLPLMDGTYDYKFTIDNWSDQENFSAGAVCTTTNGGFTNRFLDVAGSDMTLSTPDFAVCYEDTDGVDGPHDVTFIVDMSGYGGSYTTPEINGTFNGWCGGCNVLVDQGNDIWSVTLPLTEEQIEFKFAHDSWAGQENFIEGTPYTVTNGGFTNRFLQIDGDKTVSYIWEQGAALSTNDVTLNDVSLSVYPNPTRSNWNVETNNASINSVEVFDILGKQVLLVPVSGNSAVISSDNLGSGIYLAKINTDFGAKTIKLIKE